MTAITATPTTARQAGTTAHPVRRAAMVSGAAAAVATTAVAGAADAAGVPLAIDGEAIPLLGFAQLTAVGALLGGLLAAAVGRWGSEARRRSTFVAVTAVLTVLSCIPSVALPPDAATKIVLVATHVVAAAIIVPTLVRHLGTAR